MLLEDLIKMKDLGTSFIQGSRNFKHPCLEDLHTSSIILKYD